MTRWRRWIFEIRAPSDEFLAIMQRALETRGIAIEEAEHFDFTARGFGTRGYVKATWTDAGLEIRAKLKSGFFASPAALEKLLLDAGREAQATLTYEKEA
ncbi:MAG TPA: hypothetical protein VM370_06805 [Candidatus Thermoplasmatota archaeon]|nr:hypothetical protein [Candidatus Thermoplasmatota archaeon]